MKKRLSFLLLSVLALTIITGCSENGSSRPGGGNTETQDYSNSEAIAIDVDLTVLSSTMVFAEMFNIMTNPADYMGKTIKISGSYHASLFDKTGMYYHYVLIEDASACCAQGVEFILNGDHAYPDDFPVERAIIEIVGVYRSYEEFGDTFYYLAVDDITVL